MFNYTKEYREIEHLTIDTALKEFHEKLDKLEDELHLLQQENEMLRGAHVKKSNEVKLLKNSYNSNLEEQEEIIRTLQKLEKLIMKPTIHQKMQLETESILALVPIKRIYKNMTQYTCEMTK